MKTPASIAFAFALSLIITTPASAQSADGVSAADAASSEERPSRWQRFSAKHDANQDGVITRDEFHKGDERFNRLDQNLDGQLTESEFEALGDRFKEGRRGRRGGLISGADINKDGQVTAEEWASFEKALDVDGDGIVGGEEMQALRDVRRGERQRFGGRDGQKSGPQSHRFDANQDGGLDATEREALFKSFDADGDGTISAQEMPKSRRGEARSGRRGSRMGMGLLKAADVDGDRRLHSDEWQTFLSTTDVDADGVLSREELEARRPEGSPEPPAGRPAGAPSLETERLQALFTLLDANEDGVIADDERPRGRGPRGRGRR